MGIAAFLCGLFYGAFFLWVGHERACRAWTDRYIAGLLEQSWREPESCEWPWGREELWMSPAKRSGVMRDLTWADSTTAPIDFGSGTMDG
jgi:hypothetical protein